MTLFFSAKIHIGLVTDGETDSSTNHWVKFRIRGEKGLTEWMYPEAKGRDFRKGRWVLWIWGGSDNVIQSLCL